MRFYDNEENLYNTYIGSVCGTIVNKVNGLFNGKLKLSNDKNKIPKTVNYYMNKTEFDEPSISFEAPIDKQCEEPLINNYTNQNEDKNSITIDYNNHEIILTDGNGNVVNTSKIDDTLSQYPLKDIINKVYNDISNDDMDIPEK